MVNFLEEIVNICGLPYNELNNCHKIIQVGNKILYISNFIRIVDYSDKRLVLKVKKDLIEVVGQNLEIRLLNKGEVIVTGDILFSKFGEMNEK